MQRTLVAALLFGGPVLSLVPTRTAVAGAGLETRLVAVREASAAVTEPASPAQAQRADPTHCAKRVELTGASCSFSTGLMAQRVLEEGRPYTFTGKLALTTRELGSRVAAPYLIGPTNDIHVVANEVVEALVATVGEQGRVTLMGRVLEVDGVRYFVATRFEDTNS